VADWTTRSPLICGVNAENQGVFILEKGGMRTLSGGDPIDHSGYKFLCSNRTKSKRIKRFVGEEKRMSVDKKVVVWSRQGCQACQEVKGFLERENIAYLTVDVEGKDYLRDILEIKYGVRHVPVIEIGENGTYEAVIEQDFKRIKELLGKNE
jgi:glutaredoxin 3